MTSLTGQHFILDLVQSFCGVKVPSQHRRKEAPNRKTVGFYSSSRSSAIMLQFQWGREKRLTELGLIVTSGCDSSRQHRNAAPFSLCSMLLGQLATDNSQIRSENAREMSLARLVQALKNRSKASPEKKCFCTTPTKSFSPNASENETKLNQTRSLANQMNLGFFLLSDGSLTSNGDLLSQSKLLYDK